MGPAGPHIESILASCYNLYKILLWFTRLQVLPKQKIGSTHNCQAYLANKTGPLSDQCVFAQEILNLPYPASTAVRHQNSLRH